MALRDDQDLVFGRADPPAPRVPERFELAPGLTISRIVTGLWQVADMERGGRALDPDAASATMAAYARAGFDTFDMADHYGSAEIIAGRFLARVAGGENAGVNRPVMMTKWCPPPGPISADAARAGVERALKRLGVAAVDLMQFHWWTYEHPAYLDALKELAKLRGEGMIRHLGVTNFDAAHLRLLIKHGLPIVSNQVSFSLLDRRAAGELSAVCLEHGVRLLAYGALAGGFFSRRWLGAPEPSLDEIGDWSKRKYKRFIDVAGGWDGFQAMLAQIHRVADRHGVSMPAVAARWVLDHPAVAAVIVGARLGENVHVSDNASAFSFALEAEDRALLEEGVKATKPIPGDCGDEYRRPPFLTAAGDLSDHLDLASKVYVADRVEGLKDRIRVSTGSVWEPIAGYSRAIRVKDRVLVSGTTATHGADEVVCRGDPEGQTVFILDKIAASLATAGARLKDVVRTRIYLKNVDSWERVSRVHGKYFGEIRPANTLVEVSRLVGDYEVEIEAEAVI